MKKKEKSKNIRKIQKKKRIPSDLKMYSQMERQYLHDLIKAKNEDERLEAITRLRWVQQKIKKISGLL